jgi:hypothetical protein
MAEWESVDRDFAALSPAQRLEVLAAMQRDRARLDAAQTRLLAAIELDESEAGPGAELGKHFERDEVGCVLRVASTTAAARMRDAVELVMRYPATLALLDTGRLSFWHALRLVEAGVHRSDEVMAAVEARVLGRAPEQTVAEFKRAITRALNALDPQTTQQRRHAALRTRRVAFLPRDDGTTDLWAEALPAEQAAAMQGRIEALARGWKGSDERSTDQRQADALVALVLGNGDATQAGVKPVVNVVVSLSTLLDLDQQPGELDGQPITAALARAIAFDPTGTWRRIVTDPAGRLVDVSAAGYRPPARMSRLVRLQQQTCAFPGCAHRATSCELDHIRAWADGGTTSATNLQPLCARHHHLKHEGGWHVSRAPDGSTTWTSPTGNSYTRPPDLLPIDRTSDPPTADAAA